MHTNEDINPLDSHNNPPLSIQGPITKACARQLNLEVSSFISTCLFDFENRLLIYDYVYDYRNQEEDKNILKEGLGGVKGVQVEVEAQFKSTSSLSRSLGAVFTKTDTEVAYKISFGRSLYGWKGNFIELQRHQSHLTIRSELSGIIKRYS
jgi:hypothetical protein